MIEIQQNVLLKDYSTMRLGGMARYLVEINNRDQLLEALNFARENNLPVFVVGYGSNTIFSDQVFPGLIIINRIMGIKFYDKTSSELKVEVGAGEIWDNFVEKSVESGYSALESLSAIPGSVGSAPVQNIGAYGTQQSTYMLELLAFDKQTFDFTVLSNKECLFGYRSSRFNRADRGRFIIISVIYKLMVSKSSVIQQPYYQDVANYFDENKISSPTPQEFRLAVKNIRYDKLPDPIRVSNCGSFFYNPTISKTEFIKLKNQHPTLKSHETDDGRLKLYAGQLIELVGMKDFHDQKTGMSTWKNQALVLVNENAKSTADLLNFKEMIVSKVKVEFGIELLQEPELLDV